MLEEESFTGGVPKLDGSSIKGFAEIFDSDMLLLPDPSTFGIIPWGDQRFPTARMICDVHWGYQKGRFSRDPRFIAQKAEEAINSAGFSGAKPTTMLTIPRLTWSCGVVSLSHLTK